MKGYRSICLLLVLSAVLPCWARDRSYYIAAEDTEWDYAPSGRDLIEGGALPSPWSIKTHWPKTHYVEYTDASFSQRKPQPPWLGILGPVIRAEVGDTITVHFLNRSKLPHSMHPHGLRYDKDSKGAYYTPSGAGARVRPNGSFTYHWFADKDSGPARNDSSSVVWMYHPHGDEPSETNAGLIGPIVITARGMANPDGSPKDVNREFVALFMIFDELHGKDSGMFYAINGYAFGNLPGLAARQGERVRWYLLGMGSEDDLHTPHWHGKTVTYEGWHTDVIELPPASMKSADMIADNPGTWLFHCQVSEHMEDGMMATYTIVPAHRCSAPIQIVAADLWADPKTFHVTIKNTTSKPIRNLSLRFDHLLTMQYRRRPYSHTWSWPQEIPPGQQRTVDMPGWKPGYAAQILAWILFPQSVTFQDGSRWQAADNDSCYQMFWRDPGTPALVGLPPVQMELNEE